MARTVDFSDFEEARLLAGLFFARMIEELDITERTYYRWKAQGHVPLWAYRLVGALSGDLAGHGWPGWRIERGVLYYDGLNVRYHHWTPGKILQDLYGKPVSIEHNRTPANECDIPARSLEKTKPG